MSAHTPAVGAVYRSNHGKGSRRMQIRYISGQRVECVHLERWRRRFTLPLWFLSHPSCGWQS